MEIKIKGTKNKSQKQIEELLSILAQKGVITAEDANKVKKKK